MWGKVTVLPLGLLALFGTALVCGDMHEGAEGIGTAKDAENDDIINHSSKNDYPDEHRYMTTDAYQPDDQIRGVESDRRTRSDGDTYQDKAVAAYDDDYDDTYDDEIGGSEKADRPDYYGLRKTYKEILDIWHKAADLVSGPSLPGTGSDDRIFEKSDASDETNEISHGTDRKEKIKDPEKGQDLYNHHAKENVANSYKEVEIEDMQNDMPADVYMRTKKKNNHKKKTKKNKQYNEVPKHHHPKKEDKDHGKGNYKDNLITFTDRWKDVDHSGKDEQESRKILADKGYGEKDSLDSTPLWNASNHMFMDGVWDEENDGYTYIDSFDHRGDVRFPEDDSDGLRGSGETPVLIRERRPPSTDFRTGEATELYRHYGVCDNCMVKLNHSSTECSDHVDQALEFDRWTKELSDILRYGCSAPGVAMTGRCCHGYDDRLRRTIDTIIGLTRDLRLIMHDQCFKCPVDCEWSEWSCWSECPRDCLPEGYKTRTRTEIRRGAFGGRPCVGRSLEEMLCPWMPPERGEWLQWSSWSDCSATCGGHRHRTRKCKDPTVYPSCCFTPCEGKNIEVERCGRDDRCCRDRVWEQWGPWSACSIAVDDRKSLKVRFRDCGPDPRYPGEPMCPTSCPGSSSETMDCCVRATWSHWGEWNPCDVSMRDPEGNLCGSGCRNRTRECIFGNCPDDYCEGNDVDRTTCDLGPCCEPPVWLEWCPWSACSVTLGSGVKTRIRRCGPNPDKWENPTCKTGCYSRGSETETKPCSHTCPICRNPNYFEEWGTWSECVYRGDVGIRSRRRTCIHLDDNCPPCPTPFEEDTERCTCPDGEWTTWNSWGECNFNVSPAVRRRIRLCERRIYQPGCPSPTCFGEDTDEQCCGRIWSTWSSWGSCDYSLPIAVKKRTRSCTVVFERCYDQCVGPDEETKPDGCIIPPPPPCDVGRWSEWNPWSSCDCSTRIRTRSRSKLRTPGVRAPLCEPPTERVSESCVPPPSCGCQESCNGRKDGDYPSKCNLGCRYYIYCCEGTATLHECSHGQQYDSVCRSCVSPSSPTCIGGRDIYEDDLFITQKQTEIRCRRLARKKREVWRPCRLKKRHRKHSNHASDSTRP